MAKPDKVKVFISYSHKDEKLLKELEEHLSLLKRQGVIEACTDRRTSAGTEWKGQIDNELESADLVLLLISPSFMASDYCHDIEMRRALERHDAGDARVIPVILRPVDWSGAPFGKLQALPKDGKAVTTWQNKDEAFLDVAKGIREAVEEFRKALGTKVVKSPTKPPSDLETLYEMRDQQEEQGGDTTEINDKIRQLKRRMREGPTLKPGDVLGDRYALKEVVKSGGFGTVWKARDRTLSQPVALKVLHGQFSADKSRRDRFFRGARRMAKLNHENIVRIVDHEAHDGDYYFFAMEYVQGVDLAEAVRKGSLSKEEIVSIIKDVADALQYAHNKDGLVHRDVKPPNILLDCEKRGLLTDFDLVRAPDTTQMTIVGQRMGTYDFSAPEALRDSSEATYQSDIYSLAKTALWAFSGGQDPGQGQTEIKEAVEAAALSEGERAALLKALSKKPEDRFESAGEFVDALTLISVKDDPKVAAEPQGEGDGPQPPSPREISKPKSVQIATPPAHIETEEKPYQQEPSKKGKPEREAEIERPSPKWRLLKRKKIAVLTGGVLLVILCVSGWLYKIQSDSKPPTPEPIPTPLGFTCLADNPQGYPEYRHDQTGIIFVSLPGGTFNMGSPEVEEGAVGN